MTNIVHIQHSLGQVVQAAIPPPRYLRKNWVVEVRLFVCDVLRNLNPILLYNILPIWNHTFSKVKHVGRNGGKRKGSEFAAMYIILYIILRSCRLTISFILFTNTRTILFVAIMETGCFQSIVCFYIILFFRMQSTWVNYHWDGRQRSLERAPVIVHLMLLVPT